MTLPSVGAVRKPLSETVKPAKESHQESSFDELYLKKDYKGAAQYLLKNKQQFDSGIFHYNLGTVYSKMGDQATARFHLEKALQDGYINTSSLNNLNFVRSQLDVDDLTTSTSLPDQIVNYTTAIPTMGYVSITLALLVAFTLSIRLGKIQKKWAMALAFLAAFLPLVFAMTYVKDVNHAIALKDVPVYEGPSKIFNEKGKVRAGSKIILGEFKEGWFYIEFPVSLSGWISKDQLGLY